MIVEEREDDDSQEERRKAEDQDEESRTADWPQLKEQLAVREKEMEESIKNQ